MSFLQAILDGLLIGGVYAVISIGLTLVYGVMGIVNFAQAEFLTIGMFVAWFAWAFLGLDPVLAAPLSFAVAFAIGWVVQGQLIARVLSAPSVAQIFLTVGILIVITGLCLWKPIQFSELASLFGSFQIIRLVHFLCMSAIVGFVLVHVTLALLVPHSLLAMLTGGPTVGDTLAAEAVQPAPAVEAPAETTP